jgi:hypothetical protein
MTLLMEDLIVLAVGLKPKAGPNTGVLPLQFQYGVRGAELVTLTMAGRVTVGNGRIEVRDATPLPDPLPNLALSQLVASRGAELGSWMTNTPPLHLTHYFERLRLAGALSDVQVWLLYIARRTGYLVVDQNYFRDVCGRDESGADRRGAGGPGRTGARRRAGQVGLSRRRARPRARPAQAARRGEPGFGCLRFAGTWGSGQ